MEEEDKYNPDNKASASACGVAIAMSNHVDTCAGATTAVAKSLSLPPIVRA